MPNRAGKLVGALAAPDQPADIGERAVDDVAASRARPGRARSSGSSRRKSPTRRGDSEDADLVGAAEPVRLLRPLRRRRERDVLARSARRRCDSVSSAASMTMPCRSVKESMLPAVDADDPVAGQESGLLGRASRHHRLGDGQDVRPPDEREKRREDDDRRGRSSPPARPRPPGSASTAARNGRAPGAPRAASPPSPPDRGCSRRSRRPRSAHSRQAGSARASSACRAGR